MLDELTSARRKAEAIFKELRRKHPALDGYLVFWTRSGQAPIGVDLAEMLRVFPEIVLDSAVARQAREVAAELGHEKDAGRRGVLFDELARLEPQMRLVPDVRVEIRFGDLSYDLIARLRADDLVDRALTPQSASIRIVLGSVADLAGRP